MPAFAELLPSVIQGSSLGPASYIVTAADLRSRQADDEIITFADDTYTAKWQACRVYVSHNTSHQLQHQ